MFKYNIARASSYITWYLHPPPTRRVPQPLFQWRSPPWPGRTARPASKCWSWRRWRSSSRSTKRRRPKQRRTRKRRSRRRRTNRRSAHCLLVCVWLHLFSVLLPFPKINPNNEYWNYVECFDLSGWRSLEQVVLGRAFRAVSQWTNEVQRKISLAFDEHQKTQISLPGVHVVLSCPGWLGLNLSVLLPEHMGWDLVCIEQVWLVIWRGTVCVCVWQGKLNVLLMRWRFFFSQLVVFFTERWWSKPLFKSTKMLSWERKKSFYERGSFFY